MRSRATRSIRRGTREALADHEEPFRIRGALRQEVANRALPMVRQIDEMDWWCRPGVGQRSAVTTGGGEPSRIRQLFTSTDGTSLRAICRGAEELTAARSVKARRGNLDKMPLPAILHWVATTGWCSTTFAHSHICVADPAIGLRCLRATLDKEWSATPRFSTTPRLREGWLAARVSPGSPPSSPHAAARNQPPLALVVSGLQMVFPVFTQVVGPRPRGARRSMLGAARGHAGSAHFSTTAMVVQLPFELRAV